MQACLVFGVGGGGEAAVGEGGGDGRHTGVEVDGTASGESGIDRFKDACVDADGFCEGCQCGAASVESQLRIGSKHGVQVSGGVGPPVGGGRGGEERDRAGDVRRCCFAVGTCGQEAGGVSCPVLGGVVHGVAGQGQGEEVLCEAVRV
jgi:hypothetical protein